MLDKTEKEKLIEWYTEFIDLFRTEYKKLSSFEKSVIQNHDNFLSPCQIEIFWLKEPSFQLIVKSNFKDRPDKEIIVNGPYDSHEFIDKVDNLINHAKWQTKVERTELERMMYDHERTHAESLAHSLYALVYYAKEHWFTSIPHKGDYGSNSIDDYVWVYTFVGNKTESDCINEVQKYIDQIKKNAVGHAEYLKDEAAGKFSQPYIYKPQGYGVYLFPPIVVGRKPRFTPSEILRGRTIPFTGYEKAFHTDFNDTMIIMQKDGFLYVAEPQKITALHILNTVMAVANLEGLILHGIREHELAEAGYNKERIELGGFTYNLNNLRSVFFEERFGKNILRDIKRKEIEENDLKKIIHNAAIIFKNESLSEELRILVEAITHLNETEYSQAFVLGWLILEKHISQLYSSKKSSSKAKQNSEFSYVDHMLKTLKSQNVIKQDEYDEFIALKKIRNGFVHLAKQVSNEEAERCVNAAKEIMLKKYKNSKLS